MAQIHSMHDKNMTTKMPCWRQLGKHHKHSIDKVCQWYSCRKSWNLTGSYLMYKYTVSIKECDILLLWLINRYRREGRLNMKMPSYKCKTPHEKVKTVSRASYRYHGNSHTRKDQILNILNIESGPWRHLHCQSRSCIHNRLHTSTKIYFDATKLPASTFRNWISLTPYVSH